VPFQAFDYIILLPVMKLFTATIYFALLALSSMAFGQDTLLFINGKEVPAMGIRTDTEQVRLHFTPLKSSKKPIKLYQKKRKKQEAPKLEKKWFIVDGFGIIDPKDVIPGTLVSANETSVEFKQEGQNEVKTYPLEQVLAAWEDGIVLNGAKHKKGFVDYPYGRDGQPYFQKAKREKDVWIFRVFSHYQGPEETVIYRQDTASRDFFLSEAEARAYIFGRRSARRHYESVFSYIGGGIAGGSAAALNYFWAPGPAILFLVVNTSIPVKNIKTGPEDAPFKDDPLFVDGYKVQASKRKLRNGLIVAVPAVIGGVLVRYFFIQ
jgi:hypothetical protein